MSPTEPANVHSGEIYFAHAPHVLYVTRGWSEAAPLGLAEWLTVVAARDDLELRELYEQHNIDRGTVELWRELGRAAWSNLPEGEYVHFAPAGIRYLHGPTYRGGPAAARWQAMRRRLGANPTLADWLDYVDRDPYLELADEGARGERGRVRWIDRRGRTKHRFRYQPAAVWLYRRSGRFVTSPIEGRPEPERQAMAESLAADLDARVVDGADYYGLAEG